MRPCRPTFSPIIEEVFPEAPERFFRPLRCSVISSIAKRLPERSTQ